MRINNISKRLFSLFMIVCILTGMMTPANVNADVVDDSTSKAYVKNSDGDTVLTITMCKGVITILGHSHEASTNVRFETIGLTITREPITTETEAKGYTGPGPVSDAAGSGIASLTFTEKEKIPQNDGSTKIVISSARVEAALGDYFQGIVSNTPLYLHCIFDTYQTDDKGENKSIRKPNLRNWSSIMTAESWGADSLKDFKQFFNMPITFKPDKQHNTIYYYTEDGEEIGNKELTDEYPGDPVVWTNEDITKVYSNKIYGLVGCYVTLKGSRIKIPVYTKSTDDGASVQQIRNGMAGTEFGGMNIYLTYRKLADKVNIQVNAVDSDKKSLIIKDICKGSGYADTMYNQPGDKLNLTIPYNGYTYSRTRYYSYDFMNTNGKTFTINDDMAADNVPVSLRIPSNIKEGSTLTINIYYKKIDPSEIPVNIIAIDKTTGKNIMNLGSGTVKGKNVYTNTTAVKDSITAGTTVYGYLGNWEWYYKKNTAAAPNVCGGTGSSTKISFTAPSADEVNSAGITVKVYYKSSPTATPTPEPSTPIITPVLTPEPADPITLSLDAPSPEGVINGDSFKQPYFFSKQGISTTESQYVSVKTKDYLLGYTLINRTGKVTYTIPVTMVYTLQYYSATPDKYGGKKLVTAEVKDTQYIPVERAYSYWEITRLEYYTPASSKIYNYSLPGGEVTLNADSSYMDIPSLVTSHSSYISDHVIAPSQVSGITLHASGTISSDNSTRPDIDYEDLSNYAETMTDQATVKNDYLFFDGTIALSNSGCEKIAPYPETSSMKHCTTVTKDKAFFTEGKVIAATKENGKYPSNGSVTYTLNPYSINAYSSTKLFSVPVNDVIIHTPVICKPIINADNDKWTQLISPKSGAVQIVLDPDNSLNDFTVKISNTLLHSNLLGYYTRDFSKSFIDPENVSYIAKKDGVLRNEMKFPFDVYVDIDNDKNIRNDKFIKSGTWIILGRSTGRFYVPLWVQEGTYKAQFRTIAVNGTDKLDMTEETRNLSRSNYVATDEVTFQVSGRIYGLTLYDISDYPKWENVFRLDNTMLFKYFEGKTDGTQRIGFHKDYSYYYTVGTNDQYGNKTGRYDKYTVPLINGSHPKYKNLGVLKTGYAVRFRLDTTGEMYSSGCKIKITPTFYYVDSKGKNRRQVDLYYKDEIYNKQRLLVKVGTGIDLVNLMEGTTGNIYSRIPRNEIEQTAAVFGKTYNQITNQRSVMYSYSDIRLLPEFRTFIGTDYASRITGLDSYVSVKDTTGQTKTNLSKYMQRWYGTYKLPTDLHVVPTGYDVFGYMKKWGIDYKESFWLKGGYIIVNFNIVTIDKDGNKHLSYINAGNYLNNGNCSMWVTEGGILQKTDYKDNTFNWKAGDFIVYDTDKKSRDDYQGGLY